MSNRHSRSEAVAANTALTWCKGRLRGCAGVQYRPGAGGWQQGAISCTRAALPTGDTQQLHVQQDGYGASFLC